MLNHKAHGTSHSLFDLYTNTLHVPIELIVTWTFFQIDSRLNLVLLYLITLSLFYLLSKLIFSLLSVNPMPSWSFINYPHMLKSSLLLFALKKLLCRSTLSIPPLPPPILFSILYHLIQPMMAKMWLGKRAKAKSLLFAIHPFLDVVFLGFVSSLVLKSFVTWIFGYWIFSNRAPFKWKRTVSRSVSMSDECKKTSKPLSPHYSSIVSWHISNFRFNSLRSIFRW